ncbi:MAG: alpha/beta fold hydrolase [Terracidiphilus sp.]|jgi:pimeloyl-ACP methyl ester carboxylesterase
MKLVRRTIWVALVLAIAAGIGFVLRPVSYFNGSMYLREALTGVHNGQISIDGIRVHYLVAGPRNGKPVVLVHGLGGRAEDWRNLAPTLAHAGYRVYMPDLPGFGRSEWPANFSYSVRDQAHIVIDFIDAMHLDRVDLGGWSMGGWIVQIAASEIPARIERLMLFDSAGLHIDPDWDTGLFTPVNATQIDQLDALLMPSPPRVPGFVARDILRVSHQQAWVVQRAVASMLTGRDTTDALLPAFKMPLLIVWGSLDRITPLAQGEAMHQLAPQSELEVIAGCGHLAPLQCAGQIAPEMLAFVNRQAAQTRAC